MQKAELWGTRRARISAGHSWTFAGSENVSTSKIWRTDLRDDVSELLLLEDYDLALAPTTPAEGHLPIPIRPRVDAILHNLLAKSKRKVQGSADAEKLDTLFWGYEHVITRLETECQGKVRDYSLSYVLWYGDQLKLETNLVVIRAEKPIKDYLSVLAAMSMIQHNRNSDGNNKELYGIFTGTFKWVFLHLDSKNKYSSHKLDWFIQQQAIISQICGIMDNAVLSKLLCDDPVLDGWRLTRRSIRQVQQSERDYSGSLHRSTTADTDSKKLSLVNSVDSSDMPFRSLFSHGKKNKKGSRSHRLGGKKQLPIKAVTDLLPQDVEEILNLERENPKSTWTLRARERRNVPDYLKSILDDYELAFGRAEKNEAVVRTRIDAIVLTTLAAKKREEFGQFGGEKGPGKRTSTQSVSSYKSIHWGLERTIKLPWVVDGQKCLLSGKMDYALWYGRRDEAETNMVIVETKKYVSVSVGRDQVIAYMGMLHHGRKKAGRANTAIYGIATDSYDWTFIRLSPEGTLAITNLGWKDGYGAEIISHLHKIMDQAALLSPVPSHSLTRQQTVEELSGLCVE
ncbi:uncharacterized protein BJX67DRAFT_378631 [Aspergillus lucknowensis]|uniref:Fungal-type protein kinase domain-containing protein n=1 Tax=Aspergillus lucknowensis TaxID=176173 RepID=A0ABR4LZY6_9EURO